MSRFRHVDPRLCLMMLLQFAALGVWIPILPSYLKADAAQGGLGFDGYQVGWIIAIAPAIGALAAPFLAGHVADRYLSAERYLALAAATSGLLIWALSYQVSFVAWAALTVLHAASCYPAVAVANSLTLAHLSDRRRQFPSVRMWGTVGWIIVAWGFPILFLKEQVELQWLPPFFGGADRPDATARIVTALRVSAVVSLVLAGFCLLLPHTPPRAAGADRPPLRSVLLMLRRRSLRVLLITVPLLAALDRIYFLQTAPYLESIGLETSHVMPAMAIGQLAELPIMMSLGMWLKRIGFRPVIVLGAACYFVRYAIFGTTDLPIAVIVGSQFLHGVCFACTFATAAIYVELLAPAGARHTAQTGFMLVVAGPGSILGGLLNGWLERQLSSAGTVDYSGFWYACAAVGLLVALLLVCLFRDESAASNRVA